MENQTDIIPVQFEDGTTIQIQATMLGGMEQVGAKEGGMSFDNVTKSIKNIAGEIAKVIKEIQPNKATVSLGFDVATSEGQLTALLVKGTASASLTVTLEWVKENPPAKTGKVKSSRKR
jgi:NTP-dependent ternary system trypsin peptidase co-occuring protein